MPSAIACYAWCGLLCKHARVRQLECSGDIVTVTGVDLVVDCSHFAEADTRQCTSALGVLRLVANDNRYPVPQAHCVCEEKRSMLAKLQQ